MLNLYIFNHITEDKIISSLIKFKETHKETDYYIAARGLIDFATKRLTDGNIIREYILRTMLELVELPDITKLRNFLRHDVKVIYSELMEFDWDSLFAENGLMPLSDISISKVSLTEYHALNGYLISLDAMLSCESNEALGGALLAHVESFGTGIAKAYPLIRFQLD